MQMTIMKEEDSIRINEFEWNLKFDCSVTASKSDRNFWGDYHHCIHSQ